jgi:glycosyltransferase involved in cell wall biosynthesis
MTSPIHQSEITIIIPVKNGANFIEDALRSIWAQQRVRVKVIVSDNHSEDGTASILSKYAKHQNISVVTPKTSVSMIAHFNLCLELVETEYYMLLCHDDYLLGVDALDKAVMVMESMPAVSVVYCDLKYVDHRGRFLANRNFGRSDLYDQAAAATRSIVSMRNNFGIPLLVRTKSLGTHRYDLSLPYVADVEMSVYLASVGQGFHFGEPLIANRFHSSNSSRRLHGGVRAQMQRVADNYFISLSWVDKILMGVNSAVTGIAKVVFFNYLAIRNSIRNLIQSGQ